MMLAREVGPSGRIVALEPNPHNLTVAKENCRLNGLSQRRLLQAAVFNQSGTLTFGEELNGHLDDGTGSGG